MKYMVHTDSILHGYPVTSSMSDIDDIINACPTLSFEGFVYDANQNVIGANFNYMSDTDTAYMVPVGGMVMLDADGFAWYASPQVCSLYTEIDIV